MSISRFRNRWRNFSSFESWYSLDTKITLPSVMAFVIQPQYFSSFHNFHECFAEVPPSPAPSILSDAVKHIYAFRVLRAKAQVTRIVQTTMRSSVWWLSASRIRKLYVPYIRSWARAGLHYHLNEISRAPVGCLIILNFFCGVDSKTGVMHGAPLASWVTADRASSCVPGTAASRGYSASRPSST